MQLMGGTMGPGLRRGNGFEKQNEDSGKLPGLMLCRRVPSRPGRDDAYKKNKQSRAKRMMEATAGYRGRPSIQPEFSRIVKIKDPSLPAIGSRRSQPHGTLSIQASVGRDRP
jgi:hypothetical protein